MYHSTVAHLPLGVAALDHAFDEIGMLFSVSESFLLPKLITARGPRLARTCALDDLAQLFNMRSRNGLRPRGGAGPQCEFDDSLRKSSDWRSGGFSIFDSSWFNSSRFISWRYRILVILVLDPRVGIGDIAVEQVFGVIG